MKRAILLPIDTTIVTFNKWNGFSNDEFDKCFVKLSEVEKKSLKKGDQIWRDDEPYHHHGKVYGYTLRKITKVVSEEFGTRVHTGTGYFTLEHDNKSYKVKQDCEEKLRELIEANPKCFSTGYE